MGTEPKINGYRWGRFGLPPGAGRTGFQLPQSGACWAPLETHARNRRNHPGPPLGDGGFGLLGAAGIVFHPIDTRTGFRTLDDLTDNEHFLVHAP